MKILAMLFIACFAMTVSATAYAHEKVKKHHHYDQSSADHNYKKR